MARNINSELSRELEEERDKYINNEVLPEQDRNKEKNLDRKKDKNR